MYINGVVEVVLYSTLDIVLIFTKKLFDVSNFSFTSKTISSVPLSQGQYTV